MGNLKTKWWTACFMYSLTDRSEGDTDRRQVTITDDNLSLKMTDDNVSMTDDTDR